MTIEFSAWIWLSISLVISIRVFSYQASKDIQKNYGYTLIILSSSLLLMTVGSHFLETHLVFGMQAVFNIILGPLIARRSSRHFLPAFIVLAAMVVNSSFTEMLFLLSVVYLILNVFILVEDREHIPTLTAILLFFIIIQYSHGISGYAGKVIEGAMSIGFCAILFLLLRKITRTKERLDIESKKSIMQAISELIQNRELFLQSDLTLEELSAMTDFSSREISIAINDGLQSNFKNYINMFRVDRAKVLLETERDKLIKEVMYASGFRSKATFNKTFKSHTGVTPFEYKSLQAFASSGAT